MQDKFSKNQAKYFDSYIDKTKLTDLSTETVADKIEFEFVLSFMPELRNKTVLDLGCGWGRYGLRIAKFAKKVIGIDISRNSIRTASNLAKKNNINNFIGIVSNFKKNEYKDYFDYVLVVNLIHHTDNFDLILKNTKLSLKKDGKLIIFEFNPLNPLFIPFLILIGQFKSHFNKEYFRSNIFILKKCINKNGFNILRMAKYGFLPTILYNRSLWYKKINEYLNNIPIINQFSAFHLIECIPK